MGRLDNAMRRAAEQNAKATAATLEHDERGEPTEPIEPIEEVTVQYFPSEEPAFAEASASAQALADRSAGKPGGLVGPVGPGGPAGPAGPGESRVSLFEHIDTRLSTKTVVDDAMLPASREQYRRLAAALHQAQRANGFKVVMVASALAGEGKTLTAANLGLTLSESYRRNVLLVDGDLRRPSLHTVFQVPGEPGLSDGLIALDEPKLPLHRLSPRLTILPAGRPTSDPIGALTSDRMRRLIEEAREVFDWIILDTPPVGLLSDASLMSSMADGVVLVVKAESTPFDMVNRAVDAIGRDRLLGVVLNRAVEQAHRSSYAYDQYYGGTKLPAKRA